MLARLLSAHVVYMAIDNIYNYITDNILDFSPRSTINIILYVNDNGYNLQYITYICVPMQNVIIWRIVVIV